MIRRLLTFVSVFILAFSLAGMAGYLGVVSFTSSAPEVMLPDLEGENIIDVLETLTRLGLNPKVHGTQFHDTIPKYGVSRQDPESGTIIKKGRDVILYISKGFKETKMPDLRQVDLKEGLLKLEGQEIEPQRILHVFHSQTPKGAVIAQYPLPLSRVLAGEGCDLLVSKGPEPVIRAMPDLRGQTLDQALQKLAQISLEADQILTGQDPRVPQGTVLAQVPEPGSRILVSMPVRLVVCRPENGMAMRMENLTQVSQVSQWVPQGFSNRHVRVVWDLFGQEATPLNNYLKPGQMINLLIPGGIKTKIRIFIDDRLVQVKTIDPWRQDEPALWEDWTWCRNSGEDAWQ